MEEFVAYSVTGLFLGAAYAIAASGLVLTYTTTRVFNLAHGAISMVMAFAYWQLHVQDKLPTALSAVLVLFVIAPLFGLALERLVMRGLGEAPVSVSLVVTVGLFVFLVGLAQQFWPTDQFRSVPPFFGYDSFPLFGVRISYHFVLTIGLSAVVAAGLYVLLNRTRVGTAMRAAVDNRELLELFGAKSTRVSMMSWALGSALAALGGILLVSYTGLDYYTLTFLVISAFAAAMLGRLRSLPLTYLGAIALGLVTAYCQGYIAPHGGQLIQTGLQSSLPTFMLFAILIFVPQVRLRVGQVKGILAANVPGTPRTLLFSGVLIVACLVALPMLNQTNMLRFGTAIGYAMIMLSLVLLTGYGGYVSLGQFAFVGVGAAVVAKMNTTSIWAILVAVAIAAAVGAIVAIPVLRLTGLYLALATLAFAELMDKLVFQADFMFGWGGSLHAKRLSIFGYDFASTGTYVFMMTVVFVLMGIGLLALRRGPVGRLLIALRDSPAACGTLGLNQRWFRVAVFSLSAAMAGLAGALIAGLEGTISPTDFQTLQSLPLLLIAVVAGVTSVTGALFGGILLMLLPVVQATIPSLSGLVFLVIGVGAILLGRDPNGLVNVLFRAMRGAQPHMPLPPRLRRQRSTGAHAIEDGEIESVPEAQVAGHGVA
ncbi:MAG TPA: ABC transporter permease [Jatrophihabitantaceae bacterium]|jgi:branched-chain amino acid transport system permease protein|nr:ABC transporter permease [Jatrophihabitantaceae bacterium]